MSVCVCSIGRSGGWLDQCGAVEQGKPLIGVVLPIIGNCALIPNVSPQLYSIAPSRSRLIGTGREGHMGRLDKGGKRCRVEEWPQECCVMRLHTKKRKPY